MTKVTRGGRFSLPTIARQLNRLDSVRGTPRSALEFFKTGDPCTTVRTNIANPILTVIQLPGSDLLFRFVHCWFDAASVGGSYAIGTGLYQLEQLDAASSTISRSADNITTRWRLLRKGPIMKESLSTSSLLTVTFDFGDDIRLLSDSTYGIVLFSPSTEPQAVNFSLKGGERRDLTISSELAAPAGTLPTSAAFKGLTNEGGSNIAMALISLKAARALPRAEGP